MSARQADSDSDAPEEFTSKQGYQKDEDLRKVQQDNKARVIRESKERRRQWAQNLTPKPPRKQHKDTVSEDAMETESHKDAPGNRGMLPENIVQLLAAREKRIFSSDSEEEVIEKTSSSKKKRPASKKKKQSHSGIEPVILSEMAPPPCLQNTLDYLKKSKMKVHRSAAVLDNCNQAMRYLSSSCLSRNDDKFFL